ncbi:MAG: histidine phosphatase family protein [Parvibaculum sp.]|nr:histidine phosphatase family protein [Parvibaculum sp.]|tara:strand:- start:7141 stop:7671 length:531 start_codon:yes stop_codon:yes gene_type:complete
MKRLCLLRHAKSDWSDPASDDFSRPLNARGEIAADFMADYIAQSPYRPDHVLCSTARRASQTCAPLAASLGDVPVTYVDALYHAMPDALLALIHGAPDDATTLLVVAHNPGLVLLAMALARDPEDEVALRVANGVPTGGFIVFEFPDAMSWRDIADGQAETLFFGRPRDLMVPSKN